MEKECSEMPIECWRSEKGRINKLNPIKNTGGFWYQKKTVQHEKGEMTRKLYTQRYIYYVKSVAGKRKNTSFHYNWFINQTQRLLNFGVTRSHTHSRKWYNPLFECMWSLYGVFLSITNLHPHLVETTQSIYAEKWNRTPAHSAIRTTLLKLNSNKGYASQELGICQTLHTKHPLTSPSPTFCVHGK